MMGTLSAKNGTPRAGIVFLHGSGCSGEGFCEWIENTHDILSRFEQSGIKFKFPSAPLRRYTLAGGERLAVWHDRQFLSLSCPEDTDGVLDSIKIIDNSINELICEGVPENRIIIFGLSMGGHMALQAMVRSKYAVNLVCVVALSCFISEISPLWETMRKDISASTSADNIASARADSPTDPTKAVLAPLLMMHGTADSLIPEAWGCATSFKLKEHGVAVTYSTLQGLGHNMDYIELEYIYNWIIDKL